MVEVEVGIVRGGGGGSWKCLKWWRWKMELSEVVEVEVGMVK